MAKNHELYENGSVVSAVLRLALPSVVGQMILVIYNMADTLFIGMTGSDVMITAVTVALPAFMILSAVSNLFGIGAASVVSRALGRGDAARARYASDFAVWGCIAVTVFYCGTVFAFADGFVDLLGGSDPTVHENARAYILVAVVFGGVATSLGTMLSHILRAFGYSARAGAGIIAGGVCNIVLDPVFMFLIFPDGNEVVGAAVATAISNLVSLGYYTVILITKRRKIEFTVIPTAEMFKSGIPRDIFTVGVPACLMTVCENISYAVLDGLMFSWGTAAQAGIGVAKKINMLAHSFVRGMAQGVLPLIGYNYGSGNIRRMKKTVYTTLAISVAVALFCTLGFYCFSREAVSLFIRSESASLSYGSEFLKILCIGAPFSALAYTVISFFQATGKGGRSLALALMRKGVIDIPLMFILNRALPAYGLAVATPLADIICSVFAVFMFMTFLVRHTDNI